MLKQKNARGLLQTQNLAKPIVLADKSMRSFSVCASAAVKYLTTSDEINQL